MSVKRLICSLFIVILLSVSMYANYDDTLPRVVDNADLLSSNEEENLESTIQYIIDEYGFDVVILTTNSCEGKSVVDYADDFYDYTGYGYGENYDGMLFLISMEERDWYFSTCGYGITVLTDYGMDYIGDAIVSYLSSGEYHTAFSQLLGYVEEFIIQANTDKPFDVNNKYGYSYEYDYDYNYNYNYSFTDTLLNYELSSYLAFFVVALIIALLVVLIMKHNMNTIRLQNNANMYIKKDSLDMKTQRDVFLYSNVTKTLRQTESSSSGGGSSTHKSSSGRTHGGRGGKF